jgi:hypothetical protein
MGVTKKNLLLLFLRLFLRCFFSHAGFPFLVRARPPQHKSVRRARASVKFVGEAQGRNTNAPFSPRGPAARFRK